MYFLNHITHRPFNFNELSHGGKTIRFFRATCWSQFIRRLFRNLGKRNAQSLWLQAIPAMRAVVGFGKADLPQGDQTQPWRSGMNLSWGNKKIPKMELQNIINMLNMCWNKTHWWFFRKWIWNLTLLLDFCSNVFLSCCFHHVHLRLTWPSALPASTLSLTRNMCQTRKGD